MNRKSWPCGACDVGAPGTIDSNAAAGTAFTEKCGVDQTVSRRAELGDECAPCRAGRLDGIVRYGNAAWSRRSGDIRGAGCIDCYRTRACTTAEDARVLQNSRAVELRNKDRAFGLDTVQRRESDVGRPAGHVGVTGGVECHRGRNGWLFVPRS